MVIYVAMSVPRKSTRMKKHVKRGQVYVRPYMSYVRSTQNDTDKYLPKGLSLNNMQQALNTNCQRKNAKTFPFYSARLRTATKHHIKLTNMRSMFSIHSVDTYSVRRNSQQVGLNIEKTRETPWSPLITLHG